MKRWILRIAAWGAAFAAVGFLVAVSGVVPLAASSGHWAPTRWFLQFGKKRSIATHTLAGDPPDVKAPWLVMKGAGHFETGCVPCHGAPGKRMPKIAEYMLPHPPKLPDRVREWEPEELFYIVKHGLKLTGMPAWPSPYRDDEVRAMVAFLLELPRLSPGAYHELVHGPAAPHRDVSAPLGPMAIEHVPKRVTAACARCHGIDGRGRGTAAFPKLAGQRREYLLSSMRAYADDGRHSGIMQPVAVGLEDAEMRELADYYAGLPAGGSGEEGDEARVAAIERGRELAHRGVPAQRVPSCVHCHGPGATRPKDSYPILHGQYADYLALQLELFGKGIRGGGEYSRLMDPIAHRLSPEQMREVAAYYASLSSRDEDE